MIGDFDNIYYLATNKTNRARLVSLTIFFGHHQDQSSTMEEIGRGRLTLVLVAINSIALLCPLVKVKKLNSEKNKGSPTLKMGKIWWIGVVTLHDYASKLKPCLCPNIGCSSYHLSSVRMVLDKVQTSSSGNRSFRSGEAGGGGSEERGGGL